MVEHIWTVLCSHAVVDKDTNNVSLHNVIEQVNVKGTIPAPDKPLMVPINMNLISLWVRGADNKPCQGKIRIETILPSGKSISKEELTVDMSTYERFRSIVRIPAIPVEAAGNDIFRVSLNEDAAEDASKWEIVAEIPLKIVFSPVEAEPEK
jgi:hypothetical protein